ncbi:MAG: glutamate-5-semialdehyde dehydrogenase, partial [Myxococcota bacterium]
LATSRSAAARLPDPVGGDDEAWVRPNGLRVAKRRIPLGVVGIIYEARPNVTSDAAGLCLKSGNAVVLKGGRRALESNRACVAALKAGLDAAGLDPELLQFIDSTDRDAVRELLVQEDAIDLIIPRGGEGLIRFVAQHSRIPVIKHYKGVCHVVLDATASVEMAQEIVLNAKVQRPSVCNAAETLLVHRSAAARLLPDVAGALVKAGVCLHLDEAAMAICREQPWFDAQRCQAATEEDYYAEYLSLDLAVAVVEDLDAAIHWIRAYGSEHTEAIVTSDYANAERFVSEVDSSVVLVNASTRFADGGQLGLGAEIGISTTKLHAFGPMGLRELTTTKFVVHGHGHIRS